ncbi:helix-turn-helix domain-containing protein [Rhodococcus sp. SGAir0479]|uniref:helix-turn-helix domain-containing protein n=1 Tax=Rhodococcus sp. SGAir0479 TaxID=2567884 RepID=UPI0010CCDA61|nr:helix-turn-helix domain-containing protein [Rhodococcus sp. SGAir0479]QCQ92213.1 transcriptional regulator [Rhodococcus sp. SGAir0479]
MAQREPGPRNPWIAVRPGDDVGVLAERTSWAHQRFVESAQADTETVRDVVRDSWLRSRGNGVSPDLVDDQVVLDGSALEEHRIAHPLAGIRPVVRKLLVEDTAGTGLLVAMSDANGRLLWIEGDSAAKDRALDINFVEGSDWSEERVGTNAPGTALALDHSVQIFAAEHFNRAMHSWSCSAAPVHDPATGRILGALDITGGPRVAVPEALALVRATAAAAEGELRLLELASPRPLSTAVPRLEVLGGGRPALVVEGERHELSRRHAEILLLLSEHPEGLGADHLAVLLDEYDLDTVTVRAEMSRLRKVFGAHRLGSRPYRLLTELDSDVAQVRSLLDRGEVAAALQLYDGPVLAGSDAPGVVEVREELSARIRATVLRAGDARVLAKWTNSVHGRQDVSAWIAYLSTLDRNSPLHAQVEAHVRLLDRRLGPAARH